MAERPKSDITPEMRFTREQIVRKLRNKDPVFSLDVIHWIYVDLVLNNVPEFDKAMEIINEGRDIAERCARRAYGKEN